MRFKIKKAGGSIFRTNNPLEYSEVDGIVVDEQAPAPNVQGVGTGVAILVGQFQRGLTSLERVSGIKDFHQRYGKSSYLGNIQLKNKKFSTLKVIRVLASNAVLATRTFDDGGGPAVDIIRFDAKSKGVYGNSITVTIEAGSVSGKKYTVKDTTPNNKEFFPDEVYDNVVITAVGTTFANSKLVDVTVLATSAEPANVTATALATGSDGTIADTDYETAIAKAEAENAGNVLFLDQYNQTRNGYLKTHAALTQDKMVICAEEENDLVSDNETDVALLRDTDGRIIYAVNWVQTTIDGVSVFTSPAAWVASLFSQVAPNVSLAYAGNTGLLFGVTGLKKDLTRVDYKALMEAGVCAFENDSDIGFKIRSAVTTQILNSSKLTILRRRMADYLTNSIAKFLKNYQNAPNTVGNRNAAKAAIETFIRLQEKDGILPKDSEVQTGLAKIVDVETENDDDSIAAGQFRILYKQRIFSEMRFIILKAEIGESVVVTEGE